MKKTLLITGASKGIGLALAHQFLENNFDVIGTSRSGKIQEIVHPDFEVVALDLSNPESIKKATNQLLEKKEPIDILINNAGVGFDLGLDLPEEDAFRKTFEVNVTGTIFFTEQMIPKLNPTGAKLINISSKMGAIQHCFKSNAPAYRMSKSALNMYTKILTNRLQPTHKVAALHPGWVRTTISKDSHKGTLSPEESAKGIFDFVVADFENGIFWDVEGQRELGW